jgi:hypothetical protein
MAVADLNSIRKELRSFILETFLFGDESQGFENVLELVSHLEQTYSITVKDEEMVPTNLDSVDNLAAFVQRKAG